ncbi:MAG: NADase-type glycan-binding domain-containing protein [Bacillota bacterium]
MVKRKLLLLPVFIFFLLHDSAGLSAVGVIYCGGSYGTGNLKAMGSNQVEIRSEKMEIELYGDRAKVRVEYELYNTGEDVSLKAGFPSLAWQEGGQGQIAIYNYRIKAGGKELSYNFARDTGANNGGDGLNTVEHQEKYITWWLVSEIALKRNEGKNMTLTYDALYFYTENRVPGQSDYSADFFRYFLSMGTGWKGPVRSGEVRIKAATVNADKLSISLPERFKRDGDFFTWQFADLEPKPGDDIEICLNNGLSTAENADAKYGKSWFAFLGDQYYLDYRNYTVTASSAMKGDEFYSAGNVADANDRTAWAEGSKRDGIGESLTIKLNNPTRLFQIGIIPGCSKSESLYFANNRVAELEILINKSFRFTAVLPDDYVRYSAVSPKAYRFIDLDYGREVKTIKLTIAKVYRGTKYRDTYISEILLRKKLDRKPEIGVR